MVNHLDHDTRSWAFVHDPNREYRFLPYFNDAAAWRSAANAAAARGKPMPRGAAIGGDVEDLIDLVIELGERHNRVGHLAMRILLVIDEGVLVVNSGRSWISSQHAKLIAMRRHLGIGILWLQQDIQLDARFYKLGTDVMIWKLGNPTGLGRLELCFNLEPNSLQDNVPRIEQFGHIHAVNGKGFV